MKQLYTISHQLTLALLLILLSFPAKAQITFARHYATTYDQSAKDVYPTADGGYLIAATTENNIMNDLDIIVVKTDAYGNIQSTKTYGGNSVDYPNNILPTNDGNFFIVGYSLSFGTGDQDIYLLKVDQNGDTLFTRHYGGYGNEEGKEIAATTDGNYVIAAGSNSLNYSNYEMELMKIDNYGNVIWTRYYGTPLYESARSVNLCPDGGFILAGKTLNPSNSMAVVMLIKTDMNGDTLWTRNISGGSNSYEGKSIVALNDGSFVIAMDDSSASRDSDVRIIKLDASGAVVWNKMYGGFDKDIVKTIRPTTDGGYITGAISRSFGWIDPDMWILKLDANGDTTWTRHFGGYDHEHCYSARQTGDGGYVAIGHARSFSPSWEMYFIKLDPSGVVGTEEYELAESRISVYPNPSSGIVNIKTTGKTGFSTCTISNAVGEHMRCEKLEAQTGQDLLSLDLRNMSPGVYFLTFQSSTHRTVRKLVLN